MALTTCAAVWGASNTTIANFSGDARGAIIINIDDGCQSAIDHAIPLVIEHKIPATFFPICAADYFTRNLEAWQKFVDDYPEFVVLGNHTYSHAAMPKAEDAEADSRKGDAFVRKMMKLPPEALIAFCAPGGVKWGISKNDMPDVVEKFNNVVRYPHGGNVGGRKIDGYEAFVEVFDEAEALEEVQTVLFHGVGGDWFNFPADDFDRGLAELAKRRDDGRLWVAPGIRIYKYETERDAASVKTSVSGDSITVDLTCGTDIKQYDEPLTLITTLPDGFDGVEVTQGGKLCEVRIEDGRAIYQVQPASGPIRIVKKR